MAQLIYGRNAVLSALKEGKVEKLILSNSFRHEEIEKELSNRKQSFEIKSNEELSKLVDGAHQGIVAQIKDYQYSSLEEIIHKCKGKQYPLVLILDGINDPHNLGAIIRSSDAFGVDGIIIKKHGQVSLNATVAKVSTGAINFVPVAQVVNLNAAIATLKDFGFWIVASDGEAKQDYREIDYKMPTVLVIGSEGEGVSKLVIKNSDFLIKIPMYGHVNSLNASVATAVLLAQINNNRNPL